MAQEDLRTTRTRLDRLAWLLDNSIPLPGGYRIGLDGLIGLIPGVGDAVGTALSSYILSEAARLGAPKSTLLLMAYNIALETLLGMIPFAGDVFDMAWKANLRNVKLLNEYLDRPHPATASNRWLAVGLTVALIALLVVVVIVSFMILGALWQAVAG